MCGMTRLCNIVLSLCYEGNYAAQRALIDTISEQLVKPIQFDLMRTIVQ